MFTGFFFMAIFLFLIAGLGWVLHRWPMQYKGYTVERNYIDPEGYKDLDKSTSLPFEKYMLKTAQTNAKVGFVFLFLAMLFKAF